MREFVAATLIAGVFLLLGSFVCGMTATIGHAHDYATAGWQMFGAAAACFIMAAVTAMKS